MKYPTAWTVMLMLLSTPCLAGPPDGTQSLSGSLRTVHAPSPTTLGGPVKSSDPKRNLAIIGTGMHRR